MTFEDELCREALTHWIGGWPDIRGWRFDADWENEAVHITTRKIGYVDGQILTARDKISERELMQGQPHLISVKARNRRAEMAATIVALQAL